LSRLEPDFEILLVEDGGEDGSWQAIRTLAEEDRRVRGIQLSRNFGQHAAIAAGLGEAKGEWIVVMDCDLQDRPEELPKLYAARAGADVVFARRKKRKDVGYRRLGNRLFFGVLSLLSDQQADPEVGSFSVISREVARRYGEVVDRHSHYLQLIRWLGFRQVFVDVEQGERYAGRSSYTFSRLIRHSLDGIVSQSERLLHISIYVGFLFFILSVLQVAYIVFQKFAHGIGVPGWASLMAVVWLVGGVILFSLGVLGIYVGRIFEQGQSRPPYVIRSRT
jgi:dolichol-phosphate mannosyltransferase